MFTNNFDGEGTYAHNSATYPASGLFVGERIFDRATIIARTPKMILFEDTEGLKHCFINCVINVEELPDNMTEELGSPIIDPNLTMYTVTMSNANGLIHAGPYENVQNLELTPADSDFAFTTAEGNRVTMSGGTIVIHQVWADNGGSNNGGDDNGGSNNGGDDNGGGNGGGNGGDDNGGGNGGGNDGGNGDDNGGGNGGDDNGGGNGGGNGGDDNGGGNSGGNDPSTNYLQHPTFAPLPSGTKVP